ncbi:MAG: helix-turn-helix transcriptional regulator [Halodesulfurarchaeum sp.]
MESGKAETVLSVLKARRDFLEAVSDRPLTQAELADEVGVSRSTVTRAVRTLEDEELIAREDGKYTITTLGSATYRSYEGYVETVESLLEGRAFLRYVPPSSPFHPDLLRVGEVSLTEPGRAFSIRERVNERFREAVAMDGLGRTRSARQSLPIIRDKVLEEGRPTRMVLDEDLFRYLRTELAGTGFFTAENQELSVVEEAPYGLFVLDSGEKETVVLVVYDETDSMKGVLESESPRAIRWAREVLEDFDEAAVPVDELSDRRPV